MHSLRDAAGAHQVYQGYAGPDAWITAFYLALQYQPRDRPNRCCACAQRLPASHPGRFCPEDPRCQSQEVFLEDRGDRDPRVSVLQRELNPNPRVGYAGPGYYSDPEEEQDALWPPRRGFSGSGAASGPAAASASAASAAERPRAPPAAAERARDTVVAESSSLPPSPPAPSPATGDGAAAAAVAKPPPRRGAVVPRRHPVVTRASTAEAELHRRGAIAARACPRCGPCFFSYLEGPQRPFQRSPYCDRGQFFDEE